MLGTIFITTLSIFATTRVLPPLRRTIFRQVHKARSEQVKKEGGWKAFFKKDDKAKDSWNVALWRKALQAVDLAMRFTNLVPSLFEIVSKKTIFTTISKLILAKWLPEWLYKPSASTKLITGLTRQLNDRPVQSTYKLAPGILALTHLLNGKNKKQNSLIVAHTISVFLLDSADYTDKRLFEITAKMLSEKKNHIIKFLSSSDLRGVTPPADVNVDMPVHNALGDDMEMDYEKGFKLLSLLMIMVAGFLPGSSDSFGNVMSKFTTSFDRASKLEKTLEDIKGFIGLKNKVEVEVLATFTEIENKVREYQVSSHSDKIVELKSMMTYHQEANHRIDKAMRHSQSLTIKTAGMRLIKMMSALDELLITIKTSADARASIRPHPVCRHFYGPPGHGKTEFIKKFSQKLLAKQGIHAYQQHIYSIPSASKYFVGYNNQKIMQRDEFLDAGIDDSCLVHFNSLSSGTDYVMEGAALANKQMRPCHEYFLTISNLEKLVDNSIHSYNRHFIDAVNSRLKRVYVHNTLHNDKADRGESPGYNICLHPLKANQSVPVPTKDTHKCPEGIPSIDPDDLVEAMHTKRTQYFMDYEKQLADYDNACNTHQMKHSNVTVLDFCGLTPELHTQLMKHLAKDEVQKFIHGEGKPLKIMFADQEYTDDELNEAQFVFAVRGPTDNLSVTHARFLSGLRIDCEQDLGRVTEVLDSLRPMTKALPLEHVTYELEDPIPMKEDEDPFLFRMMTMLLSEVSYPMAELRRAVWYISHSLKPGRNYGLNGDDIVFRRDEDTNTILVNLAPYLRTKSNIAKLTVESATTKLDEVLESRPEIEQPKTFWESHRHHCFNVLIVALAVIGGYTAFLIQQKYFTGPEEEWDETPCELEVDSVRYKDFRVPSEEVKPVPEHQAWIYDEETKQWIKISHREAVSIKSRDHLDRFTIRVGKQWNSGDASDMLYSHFQSLREDRLKDATKPKRKPAENPFKHEARHESADDDHEEIARETVEVVATKIAAAQVTVRTPLGKVFGCAVRGNYVISTAHVVPATPGPIFIIKGGKSYAAIVVAIDRETDNLLLKVTDRNYPAAKDITKCFVTQESVTEENYSHLGIVRSDKVIQIHWGRARWNLHSNPPVTCKKFIRNTIEIFFGNARPFSKYGECGSPYIINDNRLGTAIICGLHSFAFGTTSGIGGTFVTREIIEAMIANDTRHQASEAKFVPFPGSDKKVHSAVLETLGKQRSDTIDPFPPNDRIKYRGTFRGAFVAGVETTNFKPLPVKLDTDEPRIPAIKDNSEFDEAIRTSWHKSPFGKPDRGYEQLGKMVLKDPELDQEVLDHLQHTWFAHLEEFADEALVRPLRDFEVVNGVSKGPLSTIKGFDMTKSTGYTLKKLFGISKKEQLYQQAGQPGHEVYLPRKDNEGIEFLYDYMRYLEDPNTTDEFTPYWPSTATKKDELLPKEKVEKGKIRLFSNMDFMQLFPEKKYFGWVMGFIMKHKLDLPFTAGINPLLDFHDMGDRLRNHNNFFTGDYKAWDKTLPRAIQQLAMKQILGLAALHFSPNQYKIAKRLANGMIDRLEVFNGSFYEINGGIGSGIYLTNALNSFANQGVRYYCIMKQWKDVKPESPLLSMRQILTHNVSFDHGDDKIESVSDEMAEHINYFTMKKQCARLGLTVTPGNKDAEEKHFEPFNELSFLCHTWGNFEGFEIGIQNLSSIDQVFQYSTSLDPEHVWSVHFNGLIACALHSREEFNARRKVAIENAKILSIEGHYPDYDEARHFWRQELGLLNSCEQPNGEILKTTNKPSVHQKLPTRTKDTYRSIKETMSILKKTEEPDWVIHQMETGKPPGPLTFGVMPLTETQRASNSGYLDDPPIAKDSKLRGSYGFDCKCGYTTEFPSCKTIELHRETCNQRGFLTGDYESMVQGIDVDLRAHIKDTEEHRKMVDHFGMLLFGKRYPDHDLSKFSPIEAFGYSLNFNLATAGLPWTKALDHHYKHNAHHYQHHNDWTDITSDLIDEMIADSCASVRRYEATDEAAMDKIIAGYADHKNPYNRGKPTVLLRMLENRAKEGKKRFLMSDSNLVRYKCSHCTVELATARKMYNHQLNSHKVKSCFFCGWGEGHDKYCDVLAIFRCHCGMTNADGFKLLSHSKSAHPGVAPSVSKYSPEITEHQMERTSFPSSTDKTSLDMVEGSGPVLVPIPSGGVPAVTTKMSGYTTDLKAACYQAERVELRSVSSSDTPGTTLIRIPYADLLTMTQPQRVYAWLHKKFGGILEYVFVFYGATNILGGIICAWVEDIDREYTIQQLQRRQGHTTIKLTAQEPGEVLLTDTGEIPTARFTDPPEDVIQNKKGGIIVAVFSNIKNTISDPGAVTLDYSYECKWAPNAAVTTLDDAKLEQVDALITTRLAKVDDRFLSETVSLASVVGNPLIVDDMRLNLDGPYEVPATRPVASRLIRVEDNTDTTPNPNYQKPWTSQSINLADKRKLMLNYYSPYTESPAPNQTANIVGLLPRDISASTNSVDFETGIYEKVQRHWLYYRGRATLIEEGNLLGAGASANDYTPPFNRSGATGSIEENPHPLGLKRISFAARPRSEFVFAGGPTYPLFGASSEDDAIATFFLQRFGGNTVAFNVEDDGVNLGEAIFDPKSNAVYVQNADNFGFRNIDDITKLVIRNFRVTTSNTRPSRWNAPFTTLDATTVVDVKALQISDYRKGARQTTGAQVAEHQAAALTMTELAGLMALDQGTQAAQSGMQHGMHMHAQNDAQKHQKEMLALKQAFIDTQLGKNFKRSMASGLTGAYMTSKLNAQKAKLDAQVYAQNKMVNNAYMDSLLGAGNSGMQPERVASYDTEGRKEQTTVGGTPFVQEWNRKPKDPKPKTADTFQQTGWGKTEVQRVYPVMKDNTNLPAHHGTQINWEEDVPEWLGRGTEIVREDAPQSSVDAVGVSKVEAPPPKEVATNEIPIGDGDVNEYERLNNHDTGNDPTELNTTTPVNQDGGLIMIDDDEMRGTTSI